MTDVSSREDDESLELESDPSIDDSQVGEEGEDLELESNPSSNEVGDGGEVGGEEQEEEDGSLPKEEEYYQENAFTKAVAHFPRIFATFFYAISITPAVLLFIELGHFVKTTVTLTWPDETLSCWDGVDVRTAELLYTENGTICCGAIADCSRLLVDPWYYEGPNNVTLCGFEFKVVAGDDRVYVSNVTFEPFELNEEVPEPDIALYVWIHAAVGISLGIAALLTSGGGFKAKIFGLLFFIAAEVVEAYLIIENTPAAIVGDLYEATNKDDRDRMEKLSTFFSLLGVFSVTCFDHLLMGVSIVTHCVGFRSYNTLETDAWRVRDYYIFLLCESLHS